MRIASVLMFCMASCALHAGESARARMQSFSGGLHAVSADFTQSVTDANGRRGEESRGTLALQAPRDFRWETMSPYQQTIVADGTRVWIYEPDLQQVSVRRQSAAEAHSPITVLTDLTQLDNQFTTSEAGERDGLIWLRLVSMAQEPEFEYAELGFDSHALEHMVFKDQLGNTTDIRFDHWKRNPALPASIFIFTPPPGVDVVGDATDDAQAFPIRN